MSVAELLRLPPRRLEPLGRLIHCPSCGADVDVIEVELGAPMRIRPDLCGQCIVAGQDPEPLPPSGGGAK